MTDRVSMLLKSRASLTCFRACFLPGRAKDLSTPRYVTLLPTDYTRWRSWLRHCTTSRKVKGSIPAGLIGILHWHPSGRTMALGSNQPLTEMCTRNISWGVKAAGAQGWKPYHLNVPTVLKYGRLSLLEPSGPVQACNGDCFTFTPQCTNNKHWNNMTSASHFRVPLRCKWDLRSCGMLRGVDL